MAHAVTAELIVSLQGVQNKLLRFCDDAALPRLLHDNAVRLFKL